MYILSTPKHMTGFMGVVNINHTPEVHMTGFIGVANVKHSLEVCTYVRTYMYNSI